ncbi:hypothetical protein C8R45DRAFT_1155415 [Mycena sanguinolenta]|nr:hypothetical protein C8R45DRAFT_1155415 [Mycena sanguinolenta]
MLVALLFNSSARMYNLRILLLITGALIPTTVPSLREADSDPWILAMGIGSSCLILIHHIFRLFASKLKAILDLCLTLVEICMVAYLTDFSIGNYTWSSSSIIPSLTLVSRPIQLTALLISLIWSTATIMNSPQTIMHQDFEFLSGCSQPRGPYTPWRILTNRSAAKPLVRGEFRGIAIIRAITLNVHTTGPLKFCFSLGKRGYWVKYRHHIGAPFSSIDDAYPLHISINGNDCPTLNFINGPLACGSTLPTDSKGFGFSSLFWSCTFPWQDVRTMDIAISFDVVLDMMISVIYVQLGQGNFNDISRYTEPVALMSNAHLFAAFTWTQQQVISSPLMIATLATSKNILIAELKTLQADTRYGPNTTWDPTSSTLPDSTLSIFQTRTDPVSFVQQYIETSALDGMSTMGGFWTFVNGAFALLFGANVLYFLLGRRPLSALGIVHIFQRKALIRKWHEDFPALHSEGGRPGSESAGIVAFLRERLVAVDDDDIPEDDLEAQNSSTAEYATIRTAERETNNDDTIDENESVHSDDTCSTANTTRMGGYIVDKDTMSTEE